MVNIIAQQHLLLIVAKLHITAFIGNLLQGFAVLYLNADICIYKIEPQFFGQQNTYGALACAGHTDKDNTFVGCCHDLMSNLIDAIMPEINGNLATVCIIASTL